MIVSNVGLSVSLEFDRVEAFPFPTWMIPRLFQPWPKPQLRHRTFLQAPAPPLRRLHAYGSFDHRNQKREIHETVIHPYTEN